MVQTMPLRPCALTNDTVKMPSRRPQNLVAGSASASRFAVAALSANTVRQRRPRARTTVSAIPVNTVGRQARPRVRVRLRHVTAFLSVAVLLGMLFAIGWRALGNTPISPGATTAVMTVQPGDTLWSLAQRHGNPRAYILDRVDALARLNDLAPNARLVPGQKLMVPVANPTRLAKLEPGAAPP